MIDAQILANTQLQDINYLALQQLLERNALSADEAATAASLLADWQPVSGKALFNSRLAKIDEGLQVYWLRSYANAVLLKSAATG